MDTDAIDDRLRALAHPARRRLLKLCIEREHTVSDLGDATGLRQSTTSQQLRVLKDAGLLVVRADGNRRLYRADFERLSAVRSELDAFWDDKLAALKRSAERRTRNPGSSKSSSGKRRTRKSK